MRKLTYEQALVAAQAALQEAKRNELKIGVSVVDDAGRLLVSIRDGEAGFLTSETSRAKSVAAAAFGRSTKDLVELRESNPAFWESVAGLFSEPVLPTTGAVPIIIDDVVVGAIGCGGGSPTQDHHCSEVGARSAIEHSLCSTGNSD